MASDWSGKSPYNGALSPTARDVDVRTWVGPHTLARHGREGVSLGAALTVLAASYVLDLRPWGIVIAAMLVVIWRTTTGWRPMRVTIDPVHRAIHWRRRGRRDGACEASFDELIGVEPVDSWFSDAVRLNLGARTLLVRVPAGQGSRFAESLQAVAKQPEGAAEVASDGQNPSESDGS